MSLSLPTLDKRSYIIWKVTVGVYADDYGLSAYLIGLMGAAAGTDAANTHRVKLAQEKRLITSTIDTDLLTSLGEDILTKEPHEIPKHIDQYFA